MKLDFLLRSLHQRILAIVAWLGTRAAMLGSFLAGDLGPRPARIRSLDPQVLRAIQDFRRRGSGRWRSR